MKDLDLFVFVAVFQEMLGPLLWLLLAVAAAGLLAFAVVLVRDRGLSSRRLVRAEIVGLFGGLAALALMWKVTDSGLFDAGGPIDWVLIAVIWTAGAIGTAVIAYVVMSVLTKDGLARSGTGAPS